MEDINGIEITEGCRLEYSTFTPLEKREVGEVYKHPIYNVLFVHHAPLTLVANTRDRKLKVLH